MFNDSNNDISSLLSLRCSIIKSIPSSSFTFPNTRYYRNRTVNRFWFSALGTAVFSKKTRWSLLFSSSRALFADRCRQVLSSLAAAKTAALTTTTFHDNLRLEFETGGKIELSTCESMRRGKKASFSLFKRRSVKLELISAESQKFSPSPSA